MAATGASDAELLAAERTARAEYDGRHSIPPWLRILAAVAAVAAISGVIAALMTRSAPSDEDFQRAAASRVNLLLSSTPDQPNRAKQILAGATGEFHDEFA